MPGTVDMDMQELEILAALLQRVKASGGMSLEEVDGFLCALVCITDETLAGKYIPAIFGDLEDGIPLMSELELQQMLAMIMRLYTVRFAGIGKSGGFQPLLEGGREDTGTAWAASFLSCINSIKGIDTLSDRAESIYFLPLLALAHSKVPRTDDPEAFDPIKPEEREEALEVLPRSVGGLRSAYQKGGSPDAVAAKPSRNAPCPCGSGKKYKKCCSK